MYSLGRRTKLLLSLLPTSAFLLLFFSQINFTVTPKPTKQFTIHIQKHNQVAHSTCQNTLYKDLCVSTLTSFPNLSSKSVPQIISSTINKTMYEVIASDSNCTSIKKHTKNKLAAVQQQALDDCLELFDNTVSQLKVTMSELNSRKSPAAKHYNHLRTLLSAAMTNQYTCLEGFDDSSTSSAVKAVVKAELESRLNTTCKHFSNALVMLKKIPGIVESESGDGFGAMKDGFPTWVGSKARKLLQASSANQTKYDLVVAKDGSGNFTTITDAVAAAPNSSATRFVIYIKAGAYFENVEVVSKKKNLMFLGDGIGKTVVKASRNVVDGWTTFRSATVGKKDGITMLQSCHLVQTQI